MLCTANWPSGDPRVVLPTVKIMNHSSQLSPALLQRAELQAGIFTKRQVNFAQNRDSVLTRALSNGACHRVEPGLYSLHPLLTGRARLWAGLLLGGPEARLGGDAARFARGEGSPPEFVDVWTGGCNRRNRACWRFHNGYPTKDHTDEEDKAGQAVGKLLMTPNLTPDLLSQQAEQQLDIRTRQLMLDLIRQPCDDGSKVLESTWRTNVERPHELPPISWTHSVDPGLRIIGAFDATDVRIALEPCQPVARGGSTWQRWRMDVPDPPTCTFLDDQITVSLHWADVVKRPCRVAEEVSRALNEAGSLHNPLACTHCPRVAQQPPLTQGSSLDSCPTCGSRPAYLWTPQRLSALPSFSERLRQVSASSTRGW